MPFYQFLLTRMIGQVFTMFICYAPLLPDYFHKDSMATASMISGMMAIVGGLITGSLLPNFRVWFGEAFPFYFVAVLVSIYIINCFFGL